MSECHYRIEDRLEPEGVIAVVRKFYTVKETPKGYWARDEYGPTWLSPEELIKRKVAKWVSKTSVKRYCYPTVEEAVVSFKARKRRYTQRLRYQLEQAETCVAGFDELVNIGVSRPVNLGKIPSHDDFVFDL